MRSPLAESQRAELIEAMLPEVAFDGWSLSILVLELGALYTSAVAGHPSPLSALPVQYADWAAWQRLRADIAQPGVPIATGADPG